MMPDEKKIFGTDGVRGRANAGSMTPEKILLLAMAVSSRFRNGQHRHRVVIGKDTRLSGYMIEPALTSGFSACGMDVFLLGPLPTPAMAMLTRSMRADIGVMISASHNPYHDNGLKFFGPDGFKLSDSTELEIESLIKNDPASSLSEPDHLGRVKRINDAGARYIEFAKATFAQRYSLEGLRIVVDCAHGAAYRVAPTVLWELGAEVYTVGVNPDGFNINRDCGSTRPEEMQNAVLRHRADIGIGLDGDADRVIISDEKGRIIDGDQILALIALHFKNNGILRGDTVISTVMANLAFEKFLEGQRLTLMRTGVGDRYVVEEMRRTGANVGGEPSGHIILSDYTTTGDGLVTALQVLAVAVGSERKISEICNNFKPYPQVLMSVRYPAENCIENDAVKDAIAYGKNILGTSGRLVVRKSGTEPVIRVMGEGENEQTVRDTVNGICDAIKSLE